MRYEFVKRFRLLELLWYDCMDAGEDDLSDLVVLLMMHTKKVADAAGRSGYDHRYRSEVLSGPGSSPMARILASRNDAAYRIAFCVSVGTFDMLAEEARTRMPTRDASASHRGRPVQLDHEMTLALGLKFLLTKGTLAQLSTDFGVTATIVSDALWGAAGAPGILPTLLDILREVPEARIEWPSHDDIGENAARVNARYPPPPRPGGGIVAVFAWIDGVYLPIVTPTDETLQMYYYNGYRGYCGVNCLIVFDPTGCIIWASINHNGRTNDATISHQFAREILRKGHVPLGHTIAGDHGFYIRAFLDFYDTPLTDYSERSDDALVLECQERFSAWLTIVRQAAEWGMGSLQKVFKRLTTPLPQDATKRATIIECTMRLHNLRTRRDGQNQTKTVYLAELVAGLGSADDGDDTDMDA
jgi:hypothetical protein